MGAAHRDREHRNATAQREERRAFAKCTESPVVAARPLRVDPEKMPRGEELLGRLPAPLLAVAGIDAGRHRAADVGVALEQPRRHGASQRHRILVPLLERGARDVAAAEDGVSAIGHLDLDVVPAAEPARPNFLIIFTDDQGYGDVGVFAAKGFTTPNLDRMAAEGRRFPQCLKAFFSFRHHQLVSEFPTATTQISLPNYTDPLVRDHTRY